LAVQPVQFPSPTAHAVIQHPVYLEWAPVWKKYRDIYDGIGGFRDGTYLVAHPREWKDFTNPNPSKPTNKLLARRKLARYENIAATILDQKRSALFKGEVTRTVGGESKTQKTQPHPLETWWENVDGEYCSIDDWMGDAFVGAALFGHLVHYMDRPADAAPVTAADESQPFLRAYTPIDVPDWGLTDRGRLRWVRFQEAVPRTDPTTPAATQATRERLVTEDYWQVITRENGQQSSTKGDHGFGIVPVVVQYATRRALTQFIGQSVLGDPNLFIDLYNLTSEIRELLRAQTFGMMNVPLGTTADRVSVLEAQTMMGDEKGAENVLFTPGPAQYIQPDTNNITVYQDERRDLLRTIYRLAAIPWESDSKDAEAEGSLKLKREDMNQVLASYGTECEKAEYQIAKLWFRAIYGLERWEQEWDTAQVKIAYPKTFDVTPFAEMLEQSQAAVSLEMGPTFMKELRASLVPKFLPNLTPETQAAIEKELEAAPVKSPAQQKLEEMAMRFGGTPPMAGGPGVGV